jgi:hypothetical protein
MSKFFVSYYAEKHQQYGSGTYGNIETCLENFGTYIFPELGSDIVSIEHLDEDSIAQVSQDIIKKHDYSKITLLSIIKLEQ